MNHTKRYPSLQSISMELTTTPYADWFALPQWNARPVKDKYTEVPIGLVSPPSRKARKRYNLRLR